MLVWNKIEAVDIFFLARVMGHGGVILRVTTICKIVAVYWQFCFLLCAPSLCIVYPSLDASFFFNFFSSPDWTPPTMVGTPPSDCGGRRRSFTLYCEHLRPFVTNSSVMEEV